LKVRGLPKTSSGTCVSSRAETLGLALRCYLTLTVAHFPITDYYITKGEIIMEAMDKAKAKMDSIIAGLEKEFSTIRAGRANPGVLDKIQADYYGTMTPINTMAAISVAEARILVITPWEASALKAVEKAIMASDIGINPSNDGKSIRIVFPQLTEERRKELVKQVNKYGENAKVAIRNSRRDAVEKFKALKKTSEITEDDLKNYEKDIQKLTDKSIEKIDEVCKDKEKEIMKV
jgi:ribosome recycling factor